MRISRQAYYQQWKRQHNKDEHEGYAIEFVKSQRMIHPRIGTRKLQYLMGLNGLRIGRDHLFSVLKQQRLLVSTKRAYHKTTNSHHRFHRHPNLIKDGFNLSDKSLTHYKEAVIESPRATTLTVSFRFGGKLSSESP